MKTIKLFFSLALLLLLAPTIETTAQKLYKVGFKASETLTSALEINVTPANSITLYKLAADTSVTFNAVTSHAVIGDIVTFRIKGNTRQRIITWGTNLDSPNDTIATGKTWMFTFMWDGTAYKKLCSSITD